MRIPTMDGNYRKGTPVLGVPSGSEPRSASRQPRTAQAQPRDYSPPENDRHSSDSSSPERSDRYSDSGRYNQARQPINEAVHSAIDQAEKNNNNHPISPELLNQITSQITANVLEQLKATNFPPPVSQPTHMPTEHVDSSSSTAGSPKLDRAEVYTPPSPYRASEEAAQTRLSPGSYPKSEHMSNGRHASPDGKRGVSPFSHGYQNEDNDLREGRTGRPKMPARVSTSGDFTVHERAWGKLFDESGEPKLRLGQFLRGIAVHLVEDYEPRHSLVVTPQKMQQYYEAMNVTNEIYPWKMIFDDRTSSISRMFRDLEIPHHLIQDKPTERPDIPGLTPQGFERWMTLVLRSHPDQEYERLAKTALHMPISNPDDKKERFPKELSRRMFPPNPDVKITTDLQKALTTHCAVKIPSRKNSVADAESKNSSSGAKPLDSSRSAPSQQSKGDTNNQSTVQPSRSAELPRPSATSNNYRSATVEDEKETKVDVKPLERERKPYAAQPGGGKTHGHVEIQPADSKHSYPPPLTAEPKLMRSASVSGSTRPSDQKPRPAPISIHQKAAEVLEQGQRSPRRRAGSIYHRDPPRAGRNRSPSLTRPQEYIHRSDNDIQYGSYPTNGPSSDYPPSTWRPERFGGPTDRYEQRGSFSSGGGGDTRTERERERERDPRPRFQSMGANNTVNNGDIPRQFYNNNNEEDFYRTASNNSNMAHSPAPPDGAYSQYPPSGYRPRGSTGV